MTVYTANWTTCDKPFKDCMLFFENNDFKFYFCIATRDVFKFSILTNQWYLMY